ncbi:MAG: hypothetical protein DDT33_01574 [Firmicutes bacterium]|nr:hypothetical protein [Bacillota bacterium]
MGVITAVVAYVASFILILADLIAGNITFGEAMGQVWESLKTMIFSILGAVMSGIGAFGIQLLQKGIEAASGFVNSIISWISQLPGNVWMWLLQTIMRIRIWVTDSINQAKEAGSGFVTNIIDWISQLPGRVGDWLLKTITRIRTWVTDSINQAKEAGSGFVTNIIDWISQLPGRIYTWLSDGLNRINTWRVSITSQAVQSGRDFVNNIITFISTLPGRMWEVFLSGIQMVLNFGTRVKTEATNIGRAVPDVILSGFRQIYNTGVGIFNQISGAFGRMRDGLVGAAQSIKDRVWKPISDLWNSLRRFWGWITSPFGGTSHVGGTSHRGGTGPVGGGYAGATPSRTARYSGSGFFGGVMNAAFDTTEKLSGYRPRARQYAGPGGIDDDLYPEEWECDICGAAGPYDFSKKWVDEILRIAKGWNINIPGAVLPITDFIQMGNLAAFERIAFSLISGTKHDWYWNDRYSDAEALRRRRFNCFDGAEILINLARRMGLPARMGFGQWGSTGHVWAVVKGVPFDTTALQVGQGWRSPRVRYHGPPAPTFDTPQLPGREESREESINLSGEITFKHEYTFENLPESVSREDMEEIVKKAPERKEFMNLINEQFMRILGEKRRFAGV